MDRIWELKFVISRIDLLNPKRVLTNARCSFVGDNVSDALCDVVDILGGDTTNRDTSVLSHVNAALLNHSFALLEGKTSEGEHANLSGDVRPVSLNTSLFDG